MSNVVNLIRGEDNLVRHFDLEAEFCILGYLLSADDKIYPALSNCGSLKPEDFYEEQNGQIYSQILQSVEKSGYVNKNDIIRLCEENPDIGNSAGRFVMNLVTKTTGYLDFHFKNFAKEIIELSRRRKLSLILREVLQRNQSTEITDSEELISEINLSLSNLVSNTDNGFKSIREIVISLADDLKLPANCDKTGIANLDDKMAGGLYQGHTYCIAARPKMGKTTMLGTIGYNLAKQKVKHLYVAAEMGGKEILKRYLARSVNRNPIAFYLDRDKPEFIKSISSAAFQFEDYALFKDAPSVSFSELKRIFNTAVYKHKVSGIVLDYLQLVGGKPKGQNEAEHLLEVAQWIASFCKKNNIWCLYAAQINRDGQIRSSDGIIMAAEQVYKLEMNEQGFAWMECLVSRYTLAKDIGDESNPVLKIQKAGLYFDDIGGANA